MTTEEQAGFDPRLTGGVEAPAAEHDVSRVVPVLRDGAFGQLSWPG